MENQELINTFWKESVLGLSEEILDDDELWYKYVLDLPIKLQVVYTVNLLQWQLFNGGFHQYFFNSYGQFAYLTLKNLRRIGALDSAFLLEEALKEINRENYSVDDFRKKIYNRELKRIVDFDDDLCSFLDSIDKRYDSLFEKTDDALLAFLTS